MKQFVLDYLAHEAKKASRIDSYGFDTPHADMCIELEGGKRIALFVINRAVRIPEIRERFERNTAHNLHTLFIIDGRMMPNNMDEVEPPAWMSALHSIMQGRVYAYWCERRTVIIRPVHMEWRWGGNPRKVEYGPVININNLRPIKTDCGSKYIDGIYATADFGDGAFWKKNVPYDDFKQFRYSWRQWRYTDPQKKQQEQEEWDAWEAFARNFGSAEYEADARRQRRRQQHDQPNSAAVPPHSRYFAILGVSSSATFDEVKRAYRLKARQFHPDLHPPEHKDQYTAKMATINEAFEVLSKVLGKATG
jgi:hypothetical protein